MNVIWILGAKDPEMDRIAKVLIGVGEHIEYASIGGVRVSPENAYVADPVNHEKAFISIWVECRSRGTRKVDVGVFVDHHRIGDHGYELTYTKFWEASSIGQIFGLLRHRPTPHDLLVAAVDHCPRDALAGRCHNVNADEARIHRREQIASNANLPVDTIDILVKDYESKIKMAPYINIGGEQIRDLRDLVLGEGYSVIYLCLQQAVLETTENAIFEHKSISNGKRLRVTVYGSENVVRTFVETWASANGLFNPYGVPVRGYGGAYSSLA